MKQLASIELIRVVKELKKLLLNGKINKIYVDFDRINQTKKELFFEIFVSGKGKQMLRIILPNAILITSIKPEMPSTPDGYCSYLRKYLHNARIRDIEQIGSERIIKLTLDALDRVKKSPIIYFIYIELFSKGNFIFTDEKNMILSPLEVQDWSERKIRPKEKYTYPNIEYNPFKLGEKDFAKAVEGSEKDTIVTKLALDFGLGGFYAEELCARADISKDLKKLTKKQCNELHEEFQLLIKDIENNPAQIIKKENKITNVIPCHSKKHKNSEEMQSFLEALDKMFVPNIKIKEGVTKKHDKAVQKVVTMIKSQEKQIKQCEETTIKNQKIGGAIYENYQTIEQILKQLNEARKTKSWKEIKKYKSKIIKQINENNKEIIIEL